MPRFLIAPLRNAAALFHPVPTPEASRRAEKLLLLAILLLAAIVRFWDLGSASLHKPDEDTTVLAAVHILEDGTPRFPSGVFYGRAIVHSYLIGASFMAFGVSEWSARLPSALCGILVVWLGWLVSRRFLEPVWRITFALTLALLPAMIADSQEARMYGFMVASLLAATWQTFLWESSARPWHLVFAVLWLLVGIQFQVLAVLGAGVLLFPGLARGDRRMFLQGMSALVAVGVGYLLLSNWQSSFYPEQARDEYFPGWTDPLLAGPTAGRGNTLSPALGLLVLAGGALLAFLGTRRSGAARWTVMALVLAALASQLMVQYHLAGLLWLAAIVLALRNAQKGWYWAGLLGGAVVLALAQIGSLLASDLPLRQAVGRMIGWPSVWSYLQLAQYSWVAAGVVAAGLLVALIRISRGSSVGETWLYFALTVWMPLLAVGANTWYVLPRYVEFGLVPMLLVAFVSAARFLKGRRPWLPGLAASVLVVNPAAAWHTVTDASRSADHRGAARFLQQLPLRDNDIVIVEEVLMQSYYLRDIDYWLVSPQVGGQFVVKRDGQFVDLYTHTPFVDSVAALERVIDEADGRRVFIVETAESGERAYNRGAELDTLLESGHFETIYEGSNGNRIWLASGS